MVFKTCQSNIWWVKMNSLKLLVIISTCYKKNWEIAVRAKTAINLLVLLSFFCLSSKQCLEFQALHIEDSSKITWVLGTARVCADQHEQLIYHWLILWRIIIKCIITKLRKSVLSEIFVWREKLHLKALFLFSFLVKKIYKLMACIVWSHCFSMVSKSLVDTGRQLSHFKAFW